MPTFISDRKYDAISQAETGLLNIQKLMFILIAYDGQFDANLWRKIGSLERTFCRNFGPRFKLTDYMNPKNPLENRTEILEELEPRYLRISFAWL